MRIVPKRGRIIPLGELESFLAVLVVDLTLVSVTENVVSFGDLLELMACLDGGGKEGKWRGV